ncbi:hypothetical protein HGRIS_001260 [Hohenbuehelia grisea]|uniref:Uncharacterized protein n=1 Tax=Hohenbuehelia grisea TaxID=104357 RepID=A0ABR3JNS5_9AGAR
MLCCKSLVRRITQYCSSNVCSFIEALPSYSEHSWTGLKDDLLRFYDADLAKQRYQLRDLCQFIKESKKSIKIHNLSKWKKYCRQFIRIGGFLLSHGKITLDEHAAYFWQGIPKDLRHTLEQRILARNPDRDMSEPFKVEAICRSAEAYFQRDKFLSIVIDSDSSEEDSEDSTNSKTSNEDSESDGNTSNYDSDDDWKKKKKKRKDNKKHSDKKKTSKKTRSRHHSSAPVPESDVEYPSTQHSAHDRR